MNMINDELRARIADYCSKNNVRCVPGGLVAQWKRELSAARTERATTKTAAQQKAEVLRQAAVVLCAKLGVSSVTRAQVEAWLFGETEFVDADPAVCPHERSAVH